jgi:hypothetical protein
MKHPEHLEIWRTKTHTSTHTLCLHHSAAKAEDINDFNVWVDVWVILTGLGIPESFRAEISSTIGMPS